MLKAKKIMLGLVALMLSVSGALAQNTFKDTVLFDHDKYDLNQAALDNLDALFEKIKGVEVSSINITGHTDHDGSDEYNEVLSKRRVNTVFSYFISRGIDREKITINYSGEKVPIATNSNEVGKQKNRRVVIQMLIKYGEKGQSFKLHPYLKSRVRGKRGTVITIPRDAMVLAVNNRAPGQSVNLELIENYAEPDANYFKQAIDTEGKELVANGTIDISARCKGETVKIKRGQNIKLELYTEYEGVETFIGKYSDGEIKWLKLDNSYVSIPDFGQVLFYMLVP